MKTNKGVAQKSAKEGDVSDEQVDRAMEQIEALQRKAQQFDDLQSAANRGDHKMVFNKLGVAIKPSSGDGGHTKVPHEPAQQPPQTQGQQQSQQFGQQNNQGLETPHFDTDQWQKINAAFQQRDKLLMEMKHKLDQSETQLNIMKAEAENTRLQGALHRRVSSILQSEEGGFLKHLDPEQVTEQVMRRLESFRQNHGVDTTVDEVIKNMNNEYRHVFDSYVDTIDDSEEYDDEEEGQEGQKGDQEGEGKEEEEYHLAADATEDDTKEKTKLRVIDTSDEEAMVKETDAAIDQYLEQVGQQTA